MQLSRLLDPTDRKIIASLQQDAKRTFAQVGARVGLSPSAVKRRIDRLERDGVILSYGARIDPRVFGQGIEALVEVYCSDRTAPADIADSLAGFHEILSAFTVSGEPDAVVRLRVETIGHLEGVVERLRRDPNIVRTRTMIILSTITDRSA
jgi:DNA-binding Lrp family transcriptional regulator